MTDQGHTHNRHTKLEVLTSARLTPIHITGVPFHRSCLVIEDDLNFVLMEDDLNFLVNGRRPQFIVTGRRHQLCLNGRQPHYFCK